MLGDLHPKGAGIITQTGIHSGAFGIKDLPETLHQPIAAAHLLQSLAPGIDEGIQAPQRIVRVSSGIPTQPRELYQPYPAPELYQRTPRLHQPTKERLSFFA